jgi:hypothetical protein
MPGTARQFEPQITRSGGAPSQYRFTARCSSAARQTPTRPARPPVMRLLKATSKVEAGCWDETVPMTCVQPALHIPAALSRRLGLGTLTGLFQWQRADS